MERALASSREKVRAYPGLSDPSFVDWVDYADRNRGNDPVAAARHALSEAGDAPIFVVYRDDFMTLEGQCGKFIDELAKVRDRRELVKADESFYESMDAVELLPRR